MQSFCMAAVHLDETDSVLIAQDQIEPLQTWTQRIPTRRTILVTKMCPASKGPKLPKETQFKESF